MASFPVDLWKSIARRLEIRTIARYLLLRASFASLHNKDLPSFRLDLAFKGTLFWSLVTNFSYLEDFGVKRALPFLVRSGAKSLLHLDVPALEKEPEQTVLYSKILQARGKHLISLNLRSVCAEDSADFISLALSCIDRRNIRSLVLPKHMRRESMQTFLAPGFPGLVSLEVTLFPEPDVEDGEDGVFDAAFQSLSVSPFPKLQCLTATHNGNLMYRRSPDVQQLLKAAFSNLPSLKRAVLELCSPPSPGYLGMLIEPGVVSADVEAWPTSLPQKWAESLGIPTTALFLAPNRSPFLLFWQKALQLGFGEFHDPDPLLVLFFGTSSLSNPDVANAMEVFAESVIVDQPSSWRPTTLKFVTWLVSKLEDPSLCAGTKIRLFLLSLSLVQGGSLEASLRVRILAEICQLLESLPRLLDSVLSASFPLARPMKTFLLLVDRDWAASHLPIDKPVRGRPLWFHFKKYSGALVGFQSRFDAPDASWAALVQSLLNGGRREILNALPLLIAKIKNGPACGVKFPQTPRGMDLVFTHSSLSRAVLAFASPAWQASCCQDAVLRAVASKVYYAPVWKTHMRSLGLPIPPEALQRLSDLLWQQFVFLIGPESLQSNVEMYLNNFGTNTIPSWLGDFLRADDGAPFEKFGLVLDSEQAKQKRGITKDILRRQPVVPGAAPKAWETT